MQDLKNYNKKFLIISIIAIVALAIVSITIYIYMNNELQNKEEYYNSEINQLVSTVSDYQIETISQKNHINNLKTIITSLNNDLNYTKDQWAQTNNTLAEKDTEIQNLQTGNKYSLHDPTYQEVANFIASDKTNENEFDFDTYDCENFCLDFNTNAENKGMRCALVIMYFSGIDTGHAIVGFNTVDRGMVYIEPQTDEWVENLEIGKEYWTECIVPNEGYYYEDTAHDTIREILIYW